MDPSKAVTVDLANFISYDTFMQIYKQVEADSQNDRSEHESNALLQSLDELKNITPPILDKTSNAHEGVETLFEPDFFMNNSDVLGAEMIKEQIDSETNLFGQFLLNWNNQNSQELPNENMGDIETNCLPSKNNELPKRKSKRKLHTVNTNNENPKVKVPKKQLDSMSINNENPKVKVPKKQLDSKKIINGENPPNQKNEFLKKKKPSRTSRRTFTYY